MQVRQYYVTILSAGADNMATYVESKILVGLHPFTYMAERNRKLLHRPGSAVGQDVLLSWQLLTDDDVEALKANKLYDGEKTDWIESEGLKVWDRQTVRVCTD